MATTEITLNDAATIIADLNQEYIEKYDFSRLATLDSPTAEDIILDLSLATRASLTQKSEAFDAALVALRSGMDLIDIMNIEMALYPLYLKTQEQESEYERFFLLFAKVYSAQSPKIKHNLTGNNISFFVHTLKGLAHDTTLFNLLKTNDQLFIRNWRIIIFSVEIDEDIASNFKSLGVTIVRLKTDSNIAEQLIRYSRALDIGEIVWVCLPIWLAYVATQISGITWWSLKMHPNIPGLKKYITNDGRDGQIIFNGRTWEKFTPSFSAKNDGALPADWNNRKCFFGAFCREELLEDTSYWTLVAHLIQELNISFVYCGRKSIHHRYAHLFSGTDLEKVQFLGWLPNPEEFVKQVAFVLEPHGRGHGVMATEALAARIPVLFRDDDILTHSRISKIYSDSKQKICPIKDSFWFMRYSTNEDCKDRARLLIASEEFNSGEADFQRLLAEQRQGGTFQDFALLLHYGQA